MVGAAGRGRGGEAVERDLVDLGAGGQAYGHDCERFVLDGLSEWSRTVFSNRTDGARALQSHLLAPATQARIRATGYPTDQRVCWMPAGRHDRTAVLPLA